MRALARLFRRKPKAEVFEKITLPNVQQLTDGSRHSPDLGWLEQHEFQLLFCESNTKLGHSQHCMIEDGVPLCTGYTRKRFRFWEQRTQINPNGEIERIPIPLMDHTGQEPVELGEISKIAQPRPIQGEVHAVRPYQFRELDNYKDNRVQYIRKRVDILVPYRTKTVFENVSTDGRELPRCLQGVKVDESPEMVYILRAWMYVANPFYWNDLMDDYNGHFRPVRSVQSGNEARKGWLKSYYAYPRDKDQDLKSSG